MYDASVSEKAAEVMTRTPHESSQVPHEEAPEPVASLPKD
jgi:hypothetical protein